MLNWPDEEGIARGFVSTITNPKGSIYLPAVAPFVMWPINNKDKAFFGNMIENHEYYDKYIAILSSVTSDEYCIIHKSPLPLDRRKGIAVAS